MQFNKQYQKNGNIDASLLQQVMTNFKQQYAFVMVAANRISYLNNRYS